MVAADGLLIAFKNYCPFPHWLIPQRASPILLTAMTNPSDADKFENQLVFWAKALCMRLQDEAEVDLEDSALIKPRLWKGMRHDHHQRNIRSKNRRNA